MSIFKQKLVTDNPKQSLRYLFDNYRASGDECELVEHFLYFLGHDDKEYGAEKLLNDYFPLCAPNAISKFLAERDEVDAEIYGGR